MTDLAKTNRDAYERVAHLLRLTDCEPLPMEIGAVPPCRRRSAAMRPPAVAFVASPQAREYRRSRSRAVGG